MSTIIKPILTEKVTRESETLNRYGFVVEKKANKIQIKNAVEKAYGVSVVSVNTSISRANRSTKYTKNGLITAKTGAVKKAFVVVKEGESIDLYTNI
jgi:large subunit ribosomal protein L23